MTDGNTVVTTVSISL